LEIVLLFKPFVKQPGKLKAFTALHFSAHEIRTLFYVDIEKIV